MRVHLLRSMAAAAAFTLALAGCADETIQPDPQPAPEVTLPEDALGDTTVGATYSHSFRAEGGTPPFTFAATGLPAGLALDAATGVVSGSATAAGDATVALSVTDSKSKTAGKSFPFKVFEAVTIATTSLPDGAVGLAWNQKINASGGKAPLTLSVASGSLPAGIEVQGQELSLTGTPSVEGAIDVTLQVKDANGATAKQSYAFTIAGRLQLTTSTLPVGEVNLAYTAEVAASGGKAPIVFSATGLPAGLTIDTSTGRITGVPTAAGTSSVKLSATDALQVKGEVTLELVVLDAVSLQTAALADAYVGQTYTQALAATGGQAPYTWSLASGSALPQGLALDAGGTVTGTPTAAGNANVSLVVTDALGAKATKLLPITVLQLPSISSATLPDGYVGTVYTQTLAATGGKAPYTWSLSSGTAPAGLALSANGDLSGNPSAAGSATLGITVTDANGKTATRTLAVTVYAAPAISTTSLADGYVGESYSVAIAATGGKQPYSFSSSGTLPAGITLSTAGILGGTPGATTTANLTLTVTDANGVTANQGLSLIVREKPAITTASLPDAYLGGEYNQTLATSGGKSPLTWALASGTLPAGLSFTGGVISGTPTTAGSRTFTLSVTDANNVSASKVFTLAVRDGLGISTTSVPDGYVNKPYPPTSLDVAGGKSPYTFAVTSGTLPAGLTLSSAGELGGTPTAAVSRTVTVTVTDGNNATATRQLVIDVLAMPQITTTSLADAYVGSQYSATLAGSNGRQPYTWSATGEPTGVSLSSAGELTGTANAPATATLSITLADKNGETASRSLTLTVLAAPQIATAAPADGYVGRAYTHTFSASGGKPGFTWSIATGTLPAGVNLGSGGQLTGSPTAAGTSTFTVKAVDANGVAAQQQFSITVHAAPSITTAALAEAWVNVPYNAANTATGGKGALTWSATGLPAGLSINSGTGAITGTPTAATTGVGASVELVVTDSGSVTGSKTLTLKVNPAPSITTASLADGYTGSAYAATLAATGGKAPYTWSVQSGSLPAGVTLAADGSFSGTPTASGPFSFVVQLTDSNSLTTTRSYALQIYAPPSIATAALPEGHRSSPYGITLQATGGKSPYTWSIVSGTLQAGLSLASNAITGTPTAAGTANLTLEVRDANAKAVTGTFSLVIYEAVIFTTTNMNEGYVGSAYAQTLTASGGKPPLTFHVATGSALPAGLTLDSATGAISGTPTTSGTTNVNFTARDALGKNGGGQRNIVVFDAPAITTAALDKALEGVRYSFTVTGTGGKAPFTWSATGLPSGLSLNATTGVISGTPAQGSAAAAQVTLTRKDANDKSVDRALTLTVEAPKPIPGGGTAHPGVTDTLTVFVNDFTGAVGDVGVRVRRNGQEYSPAKELKTGADGKVVFTALGGTGTDTFDITLTGKELANNSYMGFNAQVMTLAPRRAPLPGSRFGSALVYDHVAKQAVLFGGGRDGDHSDDEDAIAQFRADSATAFNNVAALETTGWTWAEALPGGLAAAPAPRHQMQSAFAFGRTVVFGGVGALDRDVWTYTTTSKRWERKAEKPNSPMARWGGAMVTLDTKNVLLFGGVGMDNTTLFNDVHVYDVETDTWKEQPTNLAPPARAQFGAAYDSGRRVLVIHGGLTKDPFSQQFAYTNETWELNTSTWTWSLTPDNAGLRPVVSPQMATNNKGEVFLFGGREQFGMETSELWRYDVTTRTWLRPTVAGTEMPMGRAFGSFVSQTLTDTLVLFGGVGQNGRRTLDDLWTLDTSNGTMPVWTRRSADLGSARTEHELTGVITGGTPLDPMNPAEQTAIYVSAVTATGETRTTQTSADADGNAPYSLRLPAGEEISVIATEFSFSGQTQRRINFVDAGKLAPLTGDTTRNLALPAVKVAPSTISGTLAFPASWTTVDQAGGSLFGALAGFNGFHWTGDAAADLTTRTHSGSLYLMARNRFDFFASAKVACEAAFSITEFTTPTVDVTLRAGATAITPGLHECTTGTVPVVPEGAKSFTVPSWANLVQLSLGPVGGVRDWYVLKPVSAGVNSLTLPLTSTLAPARVTPSQQNVQWGLQTLQLPTGVNINSVVFSGIELPAASISGARFYVRQ